MTVETQRINICGLLLLLFASAPRITRSADLKSCSPGSCMPNEAILTNWRLEAASSESSVLTIVEFCDFESFPCSRSAAMLTGLAKHHRGISLMFKHAPAPANLNSFLAHEAAIAAGVQGKFWEMHHLLFANQTKLKREDLIGYARHLNLDMGVFQQALDNHLYRAVIEQDLAEAQGLGVTSTPTLFVNGRRLVGPQGLAGLQTVIDSLLAGMPESRSSAHEILSAGPAVAIDIDRAPTKGMAGAPVRIVEFSDFECPFCAQAATLIPELLKAYPTQIQFVFKQYPLPFHRESALAHEAALAAGAQDKFWEMHDVLFCHAG